MMIHLLFSSPGLLGIPRLLWDENLLLIQHLGQLSVLVHCHNDVASPNELLIDI